ncbi:MAG TPA: hypothetical protein DG754_12350 [Bacteroidales bacterium]|nr:hypothetical protein [Bacteroidales bacterium]
MVKLTSLKSLLDRVRETERIILNAIQKDSLPSIERDLLLEKLRQAYDGLLFMDDGEGKSQSVSSETIKKQAEKVEEIMEVEDSLDISAGDISQAESIADDDYEMIKKDEAMQKEAKEEAPVAHHDLGKKKDQEQSIPLGEKYMAKKKFRNELLGQNKKDFATVLQNKPIVDLTKAIGINDKFLFTKELFNGNAGLYAKSIKQLNEFTDINDALIYIQENFSWDNDNEAASQLIDLIRRKLLHE